MILPLTHTYVVFKLRSYLHISHVPSSRTQVHGAVLPCSLTFALLSEPESDTHWDLGKLLNSRASSQGGVAGSPSVRPLREGEPGRVSVFLCWFLPRSLGTYNLMSGSISWEAITEATYV